MELTIRELSKISSLNHNTLRTYLQNYRFTKFLIDTNMRNVKFIFNKEFIDELEKYLEIKSRTGKVLLMIRKYQPIDRLRLALKNYAK